MRLISNYLKHTWIKLLKRKAEIGRKGKKKHDSIICYLKETHFRSKDINRLKVKGQKNIFNANSNQKRAGGAILILDKIDFKPKIVTGDKEGHYVLIRVNPSRRYKNYKHIHT